MIEEGDNAISLNKKSKKEKRKREEISTVEDDHDIRSKKAKKSKKDKNSIKYASEVENDINLTIQSNDSGNHDIMESTTIDANDEERRRKEKKERKAAKKAAKNALKGSKSEVSNASKELAPEHFVMKQTIAAIKPKQSKNMDKTSKFGAYSAYIEDPSIKSTSKTVVDAYRTEHRIQIVPEEDADLFKPLSSFDHLYHSLEPNCPYIINYLQTKNFKTPSAVQSQCWPPLLAGRDVIGIAMTGSGKTLAFLIPGMLMMAVNSNPVVHHKRPMPSPRMLILAPTRELAMQSFQVIEEINGPKGICIYGGVSKESQMAQLRSGVDIIVATPGRLIDLVEMKSLSLSQVIYLVLDEADRMLDEGFIPTIRQIISSCPPKRDLSLDPSSLVTRQTVMFSATWPEEVRNLAETFMSSNPVRVTVGSEELSANHRVTQIVEVLEDTSYPLRDRKLIELLNKYHQSRTNRCLIFVLYKKEAVALQRVLQGKGYKVTSIHGDKNQTERFAALNEFKDGQTPLLIATDVAARGLDIPQVEYVINYSFPLTVEDYVHRIGRTGRGGHSGISHTFFTDNDKGLAAGLVSVLTEAGQVIPSEIYKFPMYTKKKPSNVYGNYGPKPELQGSKPTKIVFAD